MIGPFRTCSMKYFTKSFLYYQQGSKSLTNNEITDDNEIIDDKQLFPKRVATQLTSLN